MRLVVDANVSPPHSVSAERPGGSLSPRAAVGTSCSPAGICLLKSNAPWGRGIKVLALAVEAGADWLVTGDEDLKVLGKHGAVEILSPAAALERLEAHAARSGR